MIMSCDSLISTNNNMKVEKEIRRGFLAYRAGRKVTETLKCKESLALIDSKRNSICATLNKSLGLIGGQPSIRNKVNCWKPKLERAWQSASKLSRNTQKVQRLEIVILNGRNLHECLAPAYKQGEDIVWSSRKLEEEKIKSFSPSAKMSNNSDDGSYRLNIGRLEERSSLNNEVNSVNVSTDKSSTARENTERSVASNGDKRVTTRSRVLKKDSNTPKKALGLRLKRRS